MGSLDGREKESTDRRKRDQIEQSLGGLYRNHVIVDVHGSRDHQHVQVRQHKELQAPCSVTNLGQPVVRDDAGGEREHGQLVHT